MKSNRITFLPYVSYVSLEDAYRKVKVIDFGTSSKSIFHITLSDKKK